MGKKSGRKVVQRQTERQLTEEYRSRLAAIVDSSEDAIASKTLEGMITSWNRAAERIFGYTAEEAIGQPITIIIPKEHLGEEEEVLARIVRGDIVDHFETVRVRKDGTRLEISLTVSPIRDRSGRIIGASKIARDITAQKQAERELKTMYVEAEQANRAKDEFLAMLGHELRNPLGAISNALYLLEHDVGDHSTKLARDVLQRQVGYLSRLIDDLLDMGRLVTGKILLRKTPLDLSESVSRAVASMRASGRFEYHDVSLQTEPVWIDADEVRIEQIVANLLGNALKYTPTGGSIRISVGKERNAAVLRVEDTGIGIPNDLLPRVFDLFVQGARGLDRTEGGMGVGLTIVRRLTELHGGSASAFSMGADQGSRFSVRFPVMATSSVSRKNASKESPTTAISESLKILVVEDNPDALEMLSMLLSAKGHEVHGVSNGIEALEYASGVTLDIAIIDLGLPQMDGYQVARELRKKEGVRDALLVALTGYGSPEDRQRSRKAGFDAHLLKPFDYEKLTSLLHGSEK
jgi:two-component system, chemotaxis family, CheB/CheR fusion protein